MHIASLSEFKVARERRLVTGYASIFDKLDHGLDIVERGAFTRTLAEDLPVGRIRVKRDHRHLVGVPVHAEEDAMGLLTVSRIGRSAIGDETLTLIEDGVLTGMSIGFHAGEQKIQLVEGHRVRRLLRVQLQEWSFVEEPMNDRAQVLSVGLKHAPPSVRTLEGIALAEHRLRVLEAAFEEQETATGLAELIADVGRYVGRRAS